MDWAQSEAWMMGHPWQSLASLSLSVSCQPLSLSRRHLQNVALGDVIPDRMKQTN